MTILYHVIEYGHMIQDEIKQKMYEAMKAKDAVRVSVLRGLLSSFTNELVAQKKKPDQILPDEEAQKVIQRSVKQRKDSIEQFESGNRNDLAEKEKAELKILEEFLPEMMSSEDIEAFVLKKKEELGITDKSKMGMLMGAVMKELSGKADGGDVKQIVEKTLT